MPTTKHHLAEVLCGFWFRKESNTWDSTCFGKFFDQIYKLGYVEKQEQKAVQFKVELNPHKEIPIPEMSEGDVRMIFKNPQKNAAIILSNNFISFHKLPDYKDWSTFINEIVKPGLNVYKEIGLGKDLVQVQSLYLNKYEFSIDKQLSDVFSFLPKTVEFGIGFENNLSFQSQYELAPNISVILKLNCHSDSIKKEKSAFLECTSFARNTGADSEDVLIKSAHDKTNQVFRKIVKS